MAPSCLNDERGQKSDTDNHVHGVHSRHREIKREKDFRGGGQRSLESKGAAGHEILFEFGVIFVKLNAEENEPQDDRQHQEPNQRLSSTRFRAMNSQSHGEAAADQHRRIGGAQPNVEAITSTGKRQQIPVPVDEMSGKHAAEEHHLGREKYPHGEPRRLVLLLDTVEVVLSKYFYLRHGLVFRNYKFPPDPSRRRMLLPSPLAPFQSYPWEAAREFPTPGPWRPMDLPQQRSRSAKTRSSRLAAAHSPPLGLRRRPST